MELERYDEKTHYEELKSWWKAHDQEAPTPGLLSKVGFVVPGIAAGFFYQTDSTLGLIENLITCPQSDARERNWALNLIVSQVLKEAFERGCELVAGFTTLPVVLKRAEKHGFEVSSKSYRLVLKRRS